MSYIRFDEYRWFESEYEPGYVYGTMDGAFEGPGVRLGQYEQFAELMMRVCERQIDDSEVLEELAGALEAELDLDRVEQ